MSNRAPVCNIDGVVIPPSAATSKLVSIPVANGNNTILVLNALRQALMNIYSQNANSSATGVNLQPALGNFKQTNIQSKLVKVVNPDDSSQYVVVRQVTSVTWNNSTTGQSITYTQPSGGS